MLNPLKKECNFVNCKNFLKVLYFNMPKTNAKFYYAVGRGRQTGVFDKWPDCKAQIDGIHNAKYKKFPSYAEAEAFVNQWKNYVSPQKVQPQTQSQPHYQSQLQSSTSRQKELFKEPERRDNPAPPQSSNNETTIETRSNNNDTMDVTAMNLRLQSYEKKFDKLMEQVGGLVSEIDRLKTKIKDIEEQMNGTSKKQNGPTDTIPEPESKRKRKLTGDSAEPAPSTSSASDDLVIKKEKMDLLTFDVGPDDYVIVYTDGCCHNNGRPTAKAGIGIWFGDDHPLNVSQPLDGPATNNNGEIQAARIAIELAAEAGVTRLKIHTDSGFLLDCVNNYMKTWRTNGWKLTSGQPVKNRVELEKLDKAMKLISLKWEKVPAHRGIHGNEMADKLANEGALQYRSR